jgi:adenylate kinase
MDKPTALKLLLVVIAIFLIWIVTSKLSKRNQTDKKDSGQKIIFSFFGAPGSGKGTLAEQCVSKLGFQVLSTGNLCREHIAKQTAIGKEIQQCTNEGRLVSDDLIIGMVKPWLIDRLSSSTPIILDGFPRTKEQAAKLVQMLKESMPEHQFRIIKIVLPKEEIVERLVNRVVCENKSCQAVYNLSMPEAQKGICPKCGNKLIQREDDKKEVIERRFEVYQKNEDDVLNYYRSTNQNIEELNISKLTPTEVFEKFKSII